MTDQDRYIPGVPCWVDTIHPDPQAATEFYGPLFGWEFEDVMPADSPVRYFIARLPGGDVGAIGSQPESPDSAVWNTYVWVEDAERTAGKVREAGGAVVVEPIEVGDSGRMAVLTDPDGAAFSVWEAKGHRGAAVVNEHGSVVFNDLRAGNLERAEAFYEAVFGWDRIDVGGFSMWALPEYGDFLERRTPGTRENMAAMGAPSRFEEVVASVAPVEQGEPPHWDVTFAVDDADAIAAKATELGGRVVLPPMDAPWVRMTVIADPQGATFTASRFVPENKDVAAGAEATAGA